jgi:hypothetical protein
MIHINKAAKSFFNVPRKIVAEVACGRGKTISRMLKDLLMTLPFGEKPNSNSIVMARICIYIIKYMLLKKCCVIC